MSLDPENPEFRKASRLASAYSNRAFVTLQGGMARIVFGESAAQVAETTYHTAVTMTPADLLSLADVIHDIIDQVYPPQGGATAAETYGALDPAYKKPTRG